MPYAFAPILYMHATFTDPPVEEIPEGGGEEGPGDLNDDEEEDLSVCGTNGMTYSSICRLLQDTGNVEVAYAGDCDADDCTGGPVSSNILIIKLLQSVPQRINLFFPPGVWY